MAMKQVRGQNGEVVTAPAARAKDARPSNVHWLTPRTWRRWIDVGLRGHGRDGVPEPGWAGRLEDRNAAFVRLLVSSGLRRSEGGSLLTFEVPGLRLDGGRYYRGKVAAGVTRSKKDRTFYAAADAIGEIEAYAESSRAWAVAKAQRKGLYERLPGARVVTEVTRRPRPVVRWRGLDGSSWECPLGELTVRERMLLFTEGPKGLEPLWMWLNEQGLPFGVHSWEGVFRAANERCERVLTTPGRVGFDPHQVFAPYATPHSARHSFALYMLVVLNDRLQAGPVADELARRSRKPRSRTQSYGEAELDRVTIAARRRFRAALQRINENAVRLQQWRNGALTEGSGEWIAGEGLDILARTGDLPRHARKDGQPGNVEARYRNALGTVAWQRLFLTREEAVALGVLLLAEFGWNLSVISGLEVPMASPDQGEDGHPTYRIPLEKRRRGPGRHHETRNVTDHGAGSPGRLITQALEATRFARAIAAGLAPAPPG